MTYLIGEIILWLALAALVGLAAGWAARGVFGVRDAAQKSETDWSARSATAEAGFEARTLAAEAANARLRADLHAAQMRAAGLEAEGGARVRELEATLRTRLHAAEALAEERGQAEARLRAALDTASAQALHRVAAAEAEAARLGAALEAADARAQAAAMPATAAADARVAALETEIAALTARLAARETPAPAAPRMAKKARPAPPPGEDDLQTIAGLGPAMEKALKGQGIVTFAALAALGADEAKALGATLRNGFAERFVRDDWAGQARAALAAREAPATKDGAP